MAMVACEFCNGWCEFFRAGPGVLGVCPTDTHSSFRMKPAGIASVKTGVGGNSTAEGGDKTENDWVEKALDVMETEDPNKARLACGDELVLLVPSAWRRRSARRVISSGSIGFLDA